MTATRLADPPVVAGAYCGTCGRHCALVTPDRLEDHSPLRDPYGTCPNTHLPHRKPRRHT
jgi:hypothetical protein